MEKTKIILLLATLLVLLVGVVSAADVSDDTSDKLESRGTDAPAVEVAVQEKTTPAMDVQEYTIEKNNKIIKEEKNTKTASSYNVTTYQELHDALTNLDDEYVTVNIKDNIKLKGTVMVESIDVASRFHVTINGEGKMIDGDHKHYFMNIHSPLLEVTVNNLTINNCTGASSLVDGSQLTAGGAIRNYATLILNNTRFVSNNAELYGGAIWNFNTLIVDNSEFNNNTLYNKDNTQMYGGAIYNHESGGTIIVNNTRFAGNNAKIGGAIYTGGTLTVTNSNFTDNNATHGGAIYTGGTLTVDNTIFDNNTADRDGGAISNGGTLTVNNTQFANNNAYGLYIEYDEIIGGYMMVGGSGGAISNAGTGTLIVNNTEFTGNHADNYGGAIDSGGTLTVTNTQFTSNNADWWGGAIYYTNGSYNITDTTFNNNTPANFIINQDNHIELEETSNYINVSYLTVIVDGVEELTNVEPEQLSTYTTPKGNHLVKLIINGTNITNNEYILSDIIDVTDQNLKDTIEKATMDMTIKLIEGLSYNIIETIILDKPDITITIDGNGQTLNGMQNQVFHINSGSTLILKDITITNAEANKGGAIYNGGNLTIINSTLENNQATATARATWDDATANANGGAIYNFYGNVIIINSTLENNQATATATSAVNYATANALGGAISNLYGSITITDSTLENNQATSMASGDWQVNVHANGGAIYNTGTLTITDSTLENNKVTTTTTGVSTTANVNASGASIYNGADNYNITDTTFYENTPADFIINETTRNIQLINNDSYISIVNFTIIADGKEIGNGTSIDNLTQFTIRDEYNNVEIVINGTDDKTLNNRYILRRSNVEVHNYTELVEAIEVAKAEKYNSYIINLLEGDYNATRSINWNESATKNLIINGNNITLDGKHEYQFIRIGNGLNLTLNNITITNYNVTATTIGEDAHAFGGAIYNDEGTLNITDSTLNNNTATATGENTIADAYGGAIYSQGGTLIITHTTLKNNQATATATGENAEAYVRGGAIYNLYGYLTITESTLENNQATTVVDDTKSIFYSYGGAIYNNMGNLTITHNTLKNNHATVIQMGEHGNACCFGGAIFYNHGNYSITDTTFYKNTPANFIINETTKNIQLINNDSYISIVNFTIMADGKEIGNGTSIENLAQFTIEDEYNNVEIVINGTDDKTLNNRYILRKSNVDVHNYTELVEAIETAKAEKYNSYTINLREGDYNATQSISWEESATKNLIINGNNITLNGKCEHQFMRIGSGLNLTLNNITITNYTATNGGAICQPVNGNLTIINSTFSKNTAKWGGAIESQGVLIVKDSVFIENQATGDEIFSWGGAIEGENIDIVNSTFINNTATLLGGVIWGANVNISISNFTENNAKLGGALFIQYSLNVSDSYFTQNNATDQGGAIYLQGRGGNDYYCENVGNHFEGNRATTETIYFQDSFTKIIKDNTYKNTTIGYNDFILTIDSSKTEFLSTESLPLKYNASLVHPDWYDENILDELTYEISIENGEKLNVTGLSADIELKNYKGDYKVNVYNDIFQTSNDVEFTVTTPTIITLSNITSTVYVGDNVVINGTLKDSEDRGLNTNITVTINNQKETVKVTNGKFQVNYTPTKEERVQVTAAFDGDKYNLQSNATKTFKVQKINTKITLQVSNTTPINNTQINITVTLTDTNTNKLAGENITITVSDKTFTVKTNNNGVAVQSYTPTRVETQTITATYLGDSQYINSSANTSITVKKINTKLTIKASNITPINNTQVNITVTLTDTNGNNLPNQNVTITVSGKTYTVKTDTSGVVTKAYTPTTLGKQIITATYKGDSKYINSTATTNITVKKINTKIMLQASNTTPINNTPINITATLTDANANKLSGQNIILNINGKNYTLKTDSNGTVTKAYTPTVVESQTITATYNGNSMYNNTTKSMKITVKNKIKTKTTVTPVTGVIGEKLTIKATVTDTNGGKVNEGNLIFKVNGVTIKDNGRLTGSTNPLKVKVVNGIATATIIPDINMVNTKNITASYIGTNIYNKSNSTPATINISKRNATIEVTTNKKIVKQGQVITITAKIYDTTGGKKTTNITQYRDEYVYFKINGITLKDKDGNMLKVKIINGTATVNYTIPLGISCVTDTQSMTPKNQTIQVGLYNKNYENIMTKTPTFQVERSNITINIAHATINNKTHKLSLQATIKDYLANVVSGPNKCVIKVNGVTLKNGTQALYFYSTDGILNIKNVNIPTAKNYNTIEIITQDRLAYKNQRNTTNIIKVVN